MRTAHASSSAPAANPAWRVGIVAASFYTEEMDALIASATESLHAAGIAQQNVTVHRVPGSFEVPLVGAALAHANAVDALIGLGIVVEGETHHARLLAEAATRGIMDVQVKERIPFAFEILYVNDIAQARDRLDKGREAAEAVVATLTTLAQLPSL
jgi:6,7-dimethyl-8-ribityllumazine synthase